MQSLKVSDQTNQSNNKKERGQMQEEGRIQDE